MKNVIEDLFFSLFLNYSLNKLKIDLSPSRFKITPSDSKSFPVDSTLQILFLGVRIEGRLIFSHDTSRTRVYIDTRFF